jgi:hypothetical protein
MDELIDFSLGDIDFEEAEWETSALQVAPFLLWPPLELRLSHTLTAPNIEVNDIPAIAEGPPASATDYAPQPVATQGRPLHSTITDIMEISRDDQGLEPVQLPRPKRCAFPCRTKLLIW